MDLLHLLRRNWAIFHPVQPAKKDDAIRIGLLGASNIAPMAIIRPAQSHPEVIIAAVAARDMKKAQAYAKKHGIPVTFEGYQALIDDPSINAVYIPLPNGLHYEWALKSLQAGKHVLLEKPSTSNATEAATLFRHPLLSTANAPVLLEAFHARFHPAWHTLKSLISPSNIEFAHTVLTCPSFMFPNDDIRFKYDLSGGTLMDLGTYNVLFLRMIFGCEPEECLEATPKLMPKGFDQKCDQAFDARWKFPNGGIGSIHADLKAKSWGGLPDILSLPMCEVVHKEVVIRDTWLSDTEEHAVVRKVVAWNMLIPTFWHRIDVTSTHVIRSIADKKVKKTWVEKGSEKAYTWEGKEESGEESWTTYRHQLEQFVNKIKGREGSGVWMDGEDSVRQSEMIDGAYMKAGIPLRPTSEYL